MDFDEAIVAHSSWKAKLNAYLSKPDGSLNPRDIRVDNKCPLGQWIHGEGRKWAGSPTYATLKLEHARFHAAAAAVVTKANSGRDVRAAVALGTGSDFSSATFAVVSALVRLKQEVR